MAKGKKKPTRRAWHMALVGAPVPWMEKHKLVMTMEDMPAIEQRLRERGFKVVRIKKRRRK